MLFYTYCIQFTNPWPSNITKPIGFGTPENVHFIVPRRSKVPSSISLIPSYGVPSTYVIDCNFSPANFEKHSTVFVFISGRLFSTSVKRAFNSFSLSQTSLSFFKYTIAFK